MNQEKKNRLKELQDRIKTLQTAIPSGEIKSLTDQVVSDHLQKIGDNLKNDSIIKYLDGLNEKIGQFRKDFNLEPLVKELNNLIDDIAILKKEIADNLKQSSEDAQSKIAALQEQLSAGLSQASADSQEFTSNGLQEIQAALDGLGNEITISNQSSDGKATSLKEAIVAIEDKLEKLGNKIKNSNQKHTEGISDVRNFSDTSIKKSIEELRKELLQRIGSIGKGGNMNRNIAIGGNTSVLSRYTDLNIKAGSNISLTYSNNNATKYLDLTITSTGGGGSVIGGTVRSVETISTSQTAASVAGTDYVYISSAGIAITLPAASSITNLYTVKNTSASSVLVIPDGADTIDSQTNLILRTQYTAVDLISDGVTNWNIT